MPVMSCRCLWRGSWGPSGRRCKGRRTSHRCTCLSVLLSRCGDVGCASTQRTQSLCLGNSHTGLVPPTRQSYIRTSRSFDAVKKTPLPSRAGATASTDAVWPWKRCSGPSAASPTLHRQQDPSAPPLSSLPSMCVPWAWAWERVAMGLEGTSASADTPLGWQLSVRTIWLSLVLADDGRDRSHTMHRPSENPAKTRGGASHSITCTSS
mmetsp:Transcript_40095/g.114252  ORF Transcript_40095/g.114252 Transcript_40095/m.114252 type:complete len:208 (+) Transcript_40095:3382-4005(+)